MWAYLKDSAELIFTGPVTCRDVSLTKPITDEVTVSNGGLELSRTPSGCSDVAIFNQTTGEIIPPENVSHEHGTKSVSISGGTSEGDSIKASYRTMVVSTPESESFGAYASAAEARNAMLAAIGVLGNDDFIRLGPTDLALKPKDEAAFEARKRVVADKKNALLGRCYCCAQVESNGSIEHLGSCWMDSV